jgi:hypothetical protein
MSGVSRFGLGQSQVYYDAAFDGNIETTMVAATGLSCFVGVDLGPNFLGVLKRVRYFPNFVKSLKLQYSVFEYSSDGVNYTVAANITTRPEEGWSFIDIPNPLNTTARYFRYRSTLANVCEINEVQFIGYVVASMANGSCPVTVAVGAIPYTLTPETFSTASATPSSRFAYSMAITPVVQTVQPNFGSSLGGTLLTVTGAGFGNTVSPVRVMVNGKQCAGDRCYCDCRV